MMTDRCGGAASLVHLVSIIQKLVNAPLIYLVVNHHHELRKENDLDHRRYPLALRITLIYDLFIHANRA